MLSYRTQVGQKKIGLSEIRARIRRKHFTHKTDLAHMVWEEALDAFRPSIEEKGYFHWEKSFQDFKNEYGIDDR